MGDITACQRSVHGSKIACWHDISACLCLLRENTLASAIVWLAKLLLECFNKSVKFEARIQVAFALQAKFGSLDQLAAVKKAVRACLRSEIARRNWYLYIAPPKQVRT